MGYNGSNTKGARSSIFSKRSSNFGNNLIAELIVFMITVPFALGWILKDKK